MKLLYCFVFIFAASPAWGQNDPFTAKRPQPREYLIILQAPDHNFGNKLREKGITPSRESANIWMAKFLSTREGEVKQLAGVKELKPAVAVLVELDSTQAIDTVMPRIEVAHGFTSRTYTNVPAIAAVLPADAVEEIRRAPGVKRITKQKVYSLTNNR